VSKMGDTAGKGQGKVPFVRILIGLPRSGKTTFANAYRGLFPIVSADEIRMLVHGQRFWADGEDMVWAVRNIYLKMLFQQGVSFIVDETNTTKVRREPIIKLAKEHGYKVEGIWFQTPTEVCIERALKDTDSKLIPIIERMEKQFEPPTEEEFNSLAEIGKEWVVSE
jgi:predicted kinase